MRIRSRNVLIAALFLSTATACTRRVQVESEPNRMEAAAASASAMMDVAGAYDFVVDIGDEDATGVMTVVPAGDGYAISMTSNMGGVTTRNIRRAGNTFTMDATTPGGEGSIELTWQSRDQVRGMVFLGEVYNLTATRRQ